MPVKLWTGLPGAGKTAVMIDCMLKFRESFPERPIYAVNINGLAPGIAEPLTLDQLWKWWELPPESLICIDECQEDDFFPLDQGKPAEWVKRLSKVRHEGMDFWMTTQHPALMSSYVRRLVDQHQHCVRKFNTSVVQRFTWGRCMDACEKGQAQKMATQSVGTLPSAVFDAYKSSNAHNMKRRIPLKAWMLPVVLVVGIAAVIAVPIVLHRSQARAVERAGGTVVGDKGQPGQIADTLLRQTDYIKWLTPRVVGVPWTAPAFDGQTVKSEPRIYCIAADDGETFCRSEQGTKIVVPSAVARMLVASGGTYNPFMAPAERAQPAKEPSSDAGKPQALPRSAALPQGKQASPDMTNRGLHDPYVPPEYVPPNT